MSNQLKPRVRFAPSPTGELHLGGARTALFNWLFAKQNKGTFLLRIEDTDAVRSKPEFVQQIKDSLQWLGLEWENPIVYQSQRQELYRSTIEKLLNKNNAYRCFCSKEQLGNERESADKRGEAYTYSGICRNLSDKIVQMYLEKQINFSVRMRVPGGNTEFQDQIYGSVKVENSQIDDFIIARTDGTPTYNLVVVVDDNDMQITHVIRGEDHISNTPKQILIYNGLEYNTPIFAHLPMILGHDKKRLSKRHSAPGIQFFRDQGYLPQTLVNYLAFLGWNPGTEEEIFSVQELIKTFNISKVQKKGAVYDDKKLNWMSGQHIFKLQPSAILKKMREFYPAWRDTSHDNYLISIVELMQERIKSLVELDEKTRYFFNDPNEYEEKAVRKRWKDNSINDIVSEYIVLLSELKQWDKDILEYTLRKITDAKQVSAGNLIHPTRLALSGVAAGPSLFNIMEILGKETCLRRINSALKRFPRTD